MKSEETPVANIQELYLELSATPENVRTARHQVADFTRRLSWNEDDTFALLLAVGEACNNAVNYGGRNVSESRMVVSCRCLTRDCLQVDVRNQGNGFHPDLGLVGQMPSDDFATHGRGFGLMRALVDTIQLLSDGHDTTVRLIKSKTL